MAIGVPRGRKALTTSAIFTSLATFFVVLRIYTRAFLVKQMGADDWSILVSLVTPQRTLKRPCCLLIRRVHRHLAGLSLGFLLEV